MSGAGAAVGLILGGGLTEVTLALDLLHQRADRPARRARSRRASWPRASARPGQARPARRDHRHPRPGRHRLRPDPRGDPATAGATRSPSSPWSPARAPARVFVVVERRSRTPLLPFRILANRTRGISFVVDAAGRRRRCSRCSTSSASSSSTCWATSPLKTGFAFLPFSAGIVAAAGLASTLAAKVDPRWIAGPGALLGCGRHVRVHPPRASTAPTPPGCCPASWCWRSAWASPSCRSP